MTAKPAINKKMKVRDLAGLVCQALKKEGIEVTLTGGAVVSIYTDNKYESYDLDFVTFAEDKKIARVMESLGFKRKEGRHFVHPDTPYFVEFPGYAPSIGNMPIRKVGELKTKGGILRILTPTQSVMDRLAAFFHWKDKQAADQARMIVKEQTVNLKAVKDWARAEGQAAQYEIWLETLKRKKGTSLPVPNSDKKPRQ